MSDSNPNPNNAVGDKINKQNREKAKEVLKSSKEKEQELIKNGAVWMKKEKTSVLVPKNKVQKYKSNGFK